MSVPVLRPQRSRRRQDPMPRKEYSTRQLGQHLSGTTISSPPRKLVLESDIHRIIHQDIKIIISSSTVLIVSTVPANELSRIDQTRTNTVFFISSFSSPKGFIPREINLLKGISRAETIHGLLNSSSCGNGIMPRCYYVPLAYCSSGFIPLKAITAPNVIYRVIPHTCA